MNINKTNVDNHNALDYAVDNNAKECGEFLNSRGAVCHFFAYPSTWMSKVQYLKKEK